MAERDRRVDAVIDFSKMVQFSRLVAGATSPEETRPVLADAVVEHLGVDAAAVLRVDEDDLVLVASRNLPPALEGWRTPGDTLGPELGDALVTAAGGELAHASVMPLVVGGDVYGALVLLGKEPIALDPAHRELADVLVDLAAIATARAESHAAQSRSLAELRASREVLARSERLRLLGQMAAGISHDVKNILNPLGLQLEILRRRIARGEAAKARETLDTMGQVIRAGVGVLDRLRAFSRTDEDAPVEIVEVDKAVATAVELTRPRLAQHGAIALATELVATRPIRVAGAELTTAVVNLIVNATEAMIDGGAITVSTGDDADGVWIAVADTGPGMPPEVERRVFEPFFTTKVEGTGLGLAMIYAFVQRHHGRITVATGSGQGTRFVMWFPAATG